MTTKNPEIAVLCIENEAEGPFHALEFFEIEISTLTTLTSIIFTYLLVMVQFNDSDFKSYQIPTQNVTEGEK